jgi:ketol-acid reductoisomerase
MRDRISGTAAYGGLTRGSRIVDDHVRDNMRAVLRDIESGTFAEEFLREHARTRDLAAAEADGPLATEGRRVLPRLEAARPPRGDDQ